MRSIVRCASAACLFLLCGSASAQITWVNGTPAGEQLMGTAGPNWIVAGGGDDQIYDGPDIGRNDGKEDTIFAQDGGQDTIHAGPEDVIVGDPTDQVIIRDGEGNVFFTGPAGLYKLFRDLARAIENALAALAAVMGPEQAKDEVFAILMDVRAASPPDAVEIIDMVIDAYLMD